MPIYMHIEGAKGNVSSHQHKGWMELRSCSYDVTKKKDEGSGQEDSEDQEDKSLVDISHVSLTKVSDSATTTLIAWMVEGETIDKVTIEAVKENGQWWYRYTFFNVKILEFKVNGEEDTTPTEDLQCSCETLRIDTIWIMPDNVPPGTRDADWWASVPNPLSETGTFDE